MGPPPGGMNHVIGGPLVFMICIIYKSTATVIKGISIIL